MITVWQIAIGKIPDKIKFCMDTVSSFACRKGYNYSVVHELSDISRGVTNLRNLCDFEKIHILSTTPYSLVLDWDIYLSDDFDVTFSDDFLINACGDNFLYNANKLDVFAAIESYMIRTFKSENHTGPLYNAWCANSQLVKGHNFILQTWKHFKYSEKRSKGK